MTPCILFEDEHLLVANKPAGLNTHGPGPFAGEGLYEWLRHREPCWAKLAIIHRLDKETSGVIVFGKTPIANRSLTEQFTRQQIQKRYLLLTDRTPKRDTVTVSSKLLRTGNRYSTGALGELAETRFHRTALPCPGPNLVALTAEPRTGRTHQIRVHAAESGFPILGDVLYGGSPFSRVCLHAAEITLHHPLSNSQLTFRAPVDFQGDSRSALRTALIDPQQCNAYRLIHGASDGWPGWFVDRLGDYLLSQSEHALNDGQHAELSRILLHHSLAGAYHKVLNRQVRRTTPGESAPRLVLGRAAPERFVILENGLEFELGFNEGYSVGLFLDQRDNRRRLLTGHIAADFQLPWFQSPEPKAEILNAFAYTCAFSVCASKAGARVTSLDLSKKYLGWGRLNFTLNGLDPAHHDFIFGDTLDWLRRLAKKQRSFDAVVLDPPTFSQSKEHGAFRVEKDFGCLVTAALPVLKSGGILLASTNAADWPPEDFLAAIHNAINSVGRKILRQHYAPQPPDFPVSREESAYLKTVWLQMA